MSYQKRENFFPLLITASETRISIEILKGRENGMKRRHINKELTKQNIIDRLKRISTKEALCEITNIDSKTMTYQFKHLSIKLEDLVFYADLCNCSLEELVVFDDDTYLSFYGERPGKFNKRDRYDEDFSGFLTKEDLSIYFDFVQDSRDCEIRNLSEFLLYSPLISKEGYGYLWNHLETSLIAGSKFYLTDILNEIYKHYILDSPAKYFADMFRDNVLRSKGDTNQAKLLLSKIPAIRTGYEDYSRLLGLQNMFSRMKPDPAQRFVGLENNDIPDYNKIADLIIQSIIDENNRFNTQLFLKSQMFLDINELI